MDVPTILNAIARDAEHGELVFPTHIQLAQQVLRLLDDPECSIEQLGRLVLGEPLLAAKVLGVANSLAYNPSGRASGDLKAAISRLGFKTLRALSMSVIVRQMQSLPASAAHRELAARLWRHTTQVATLARVIARKMSDQDPETAFFAGVVHEVGGFYLLSQVNRYPELLADLDTPRLGAGEAPIGRAVLKTLGVSDNILQAIEAMWEGYLAMPPVSLGDTLILANELADTESPLDALWGISSQGVAADIDLLIGEEMLKDIVAEARDEMNALIAAIDY